MNTPNPPLYLEARGANPTLGDGHRGLWYDRFFNQYNSEWKIYKEDKQNGTEEGKKKWIDLVKGDVGDRKALEDATTRLAALCESRNGKSNIYIATWHFATGLGNPHPVENGFLWHPTLGTPYIPGAAVKGLVRAWMEGGWDKDRDNAKLHQWFGSEDKLPTACERDTKAGDFVFFDALPVEPITLKADVMTPHMSDWYEKGGVDPMNPKVTPADWHSPVPVPFLVADKPKFMFAIAPRNGKENKGELSDVMAALASALEWLGAGGKTAVGYGVFKKVKVVVPKLVSKADDKVKAFKAGDQVKVNVVAKEGNRYTLREVETTQGDIIHEGYLPWEIGQRLKVAVVSIGTDGRIKKIRPS